MPELPSVFHAKDHEGVSDGIKPIPEGWYPAQIISTKLKDASSGQGNKFIEMIFNIVEGEYAAKKIYHNLNIIHTNKTAQAIAERHLKSICDALNLESVINTEELHGQPMQILVGIQPASAKWPARNNIKNYKSIDDLDDSVDDSPFD